MPRGDGMKGQASTQAKKELRKETRERREIALQFKILDRIKNRNRRGG